MIIQWICVAQSGILCHQQGQRRAQSFVISMHIQQSGHQLTSETNEELWTSHSFIDDLLLFQSVDRNTWCSESRSTAACRKPSIGRAPASATENAVHIHVSVQGPEIMHRGRTWEKRSGVIFELWPTMCYSNLSDFTLFRFAGPVVCLLFCE